MMCGRSIYILSSFAQVLEKSFRICQDKIKETKPDYVFILPWNLKDEIMTQLQYIREWGGKFVVPIPEVKIL